MTEHQQKSSKIDIQKAWEHFLSNSYTSEDWRLIIASLKDDDDCRGFYEASDKEWMLSLDVKQLETETQRAAYRTQATEFLAEYEKNRRMRQPQRPARKRLRFRTVYITILLCMFMIPAVYYYLKPDQPQQEIQYIEITTSRGEIRTITLPDSSEVTINAHSALKYPSVFTGKERSVELKGEASFSITPNTDHPFVVKAGISTVTVFGTVFNVMAYQEDQYLMVSVLSGKVLVDVEEGQAVLRQNDQLKLDKVTGNFEKVNIDASKYIAWTDGKLYFYRTPIQEVVNMINRRYPQLNLELAEGKYPNLISGEHDNKSADAILTSVIYSTGMKYKKENNKIILYQAKQN